MKFRALNIRSDLSKGGKDAIEELISFIRLVMLHEFKSLMDIKYNLCTPHFSKQAF